VSRHGTGRDTRLGSRALAVGIIAALTALGGCISEPSDDDSRDSPTTTQSASGAPTFPDANSTGVRPGVSLRESESITVTEDGAVIEGLHVFGRITIDADDVTIRDTLVQTSTNLYPILVEKGTTGAVIEYVEVDNEGSTGIGILVRGQATIRNVDVHSANDGIRIQADDVVVENSFIHDLARISGGHHDAIQIRRGTNITISGNNLQAYHAGTDDPMNAAIQIGSLLGEEPISNLLVVGNLMNGGNYTVNGGRATDLDSARYADNRFGRDFRYGPVGNLHNSIWEDTNVFHDSGARAR